MPLERLVNLTVARKGMICLPSRHVSFFSRGKKKEENKNEETFSIDGDQIDRELMIREKNEELELKRNKSNLNPHHRNMILGLPPNNMELIDCHKTMRYKRKMFGMYGNKSGVDPGALWYLKSDLAESDEFEKIAFPYSVQESIERALEVKRKEEERIWEREKKIIENLNKLEDWKRQVQERAAKKLADMEAAKAKKDALIEEVRRHFGYKIDPRDEKFKELLLQKEKDYKKKLKEQKAKAKQERLLEKLGKEA